MAYPNQYSILPGVLLLWYLDELRRFSKSQKTFSKTAKPFLIVCILKTKRCIGMKLCMKGNIVHIENMWKKQLRVAGWGGGGGEKQGLGPRNDVLTTCKAIR